MSESWEEMDEVDEVDEVDEAQLMDVRLLAPSLGSGKGSTYRRRAPDPLAGNRHVSRAVRPGVPSYQLSSLDERPTRASASFSLPYDAALQLPPFSVFNSFLD
ncbi:hypothetical protein CORC01_09775 [Colletotrichum orchidophilum]|uniref:Uncharacterized protein n=1 Tax=Colletotrichum orchidophilum TaxID=1209926 RepID=A0A1G4B0S5_9PEZI|nr:uncharacterized protein CORC01_09775 [Colletotrichum orchidophilum]OHE94981.1 hypothetical protein CORC01_09775 [Colletotrichum orchidophilum]